MEITNKKDIIEKFQQNQHVIDDTNSYENYHLPFCDKIINNAVRYIMISGLIEYDDSRIPLTACLYSANYNPCECYIDTDDDMLHIRRCNGCHFNPSKFILSWGPYPDAEQLKKYNDMCKSRNTKSLSFYYGYDIKCIHLADGTKIYPAE